MKIKMRSRKILKISRLWSINSTCRIVFCIIAIETNDHEIRVNIPTTECRRSRARFGLVAREGVGAARSFDDDAAWKLSEDVKSVGGRKTKAVSTMSEMNPPVVV